jgi:hypothetical protein
MGLHHATSIRSRMARGRLGLTTRMKRRTRTARDVEHCQSRGRCDRQNPPEARRQGVIESGRQAVVSRCRPAMTSLGEVSTRALVDTILGTAGRGRPEAPR